MAVKHKKWLTLTLLLGLLNSQHIFAAPEQIYLFRHSEKQAGKDPALTERGKQRANYLISLVARSKTLHVFSSDYQRTLQTAAPLAKHFSTKVNVYDARNLEALKSELLKLQGDVAVIGHSNTTPELAALLANTPVKLMHEKDFSSYYRLTKQSSNKESAYSVRKLTMDFN
jgi:2,3-bisphosphoglycerate-dependent phosphoglycerate mutase